MTKKQTAALSRMICREISRFDGDNTIQAGVHTAYDRYIVTDGTAAIILPEMPDTLRKGSQMDSIYDVIRRNMENADHILADTVTADHIRTWKQLAKPWKAGKDAKTGAVPVEITAQNNRITITGSSNPCGLIDAVEAIGAGAMLYLGRGKCSSFPSLLVYPKDWMAQRAFAFGYVLPLRILG